MLILDSFGRNVSIGSIAIAAFRAELYVVAVLGLVALQTAMIAGLLLQRRRRRRVEEDLAFSEQRLQLIANSLPALIAHVDLEERHNYANLAYKDWFGLEPQQLFGRSIREVLGEELYSSVRPFVELAHSRASGSRSPRIQFWKAEKRVPSTPPTFPIATTWVRCGGSTPWCSTRQIARAPSRRPGASSTSWPMQIGCR